MTISNYFTRFHSPLLEKFHVLLSCCQLNSIKLVMHSPKIFTAIYLVKFEGRETEDNPVNVMMK